MNAEVEAATPLATERAVKPAAPLRDPGVEFGRPTSKRPDFNACVCALASHSSGCVCSNDGVRRGFPLPVHER